jgi:predicted AAA+ superfamily ATPase
VKSPKVFLRDSGVLHALLGLESYDALLGHPSAGASWEGFVIEQLLSQLPSSWEAFFYRTNAGAEVDLVLATSGRKRVVAVEMKLSAAPKPSRGFWSALEDLEPQKSFVVYPGAERYPLRPSVFALPVTQLSKVWKR